MPDTRRNHERNRNLFTALNCLRLSSITSTNDILKQRLKASRFDKLWAIALEQTFGRGRQGRQWHSPRGRGLYASFMFRNLSATKLNLIPQLIPVAITKAVNRVLGLRAEIKWPNDIILNGKKIGGVLSESLPETSGFAIIAGVGINCANGPDELPLRSMYPASSLSIESGRKVSPWLVLPELVKAVNELWIRSRNGDDLGIRRMWKELVIVPKGRLQIRLGDGQLLDGSVEDISLDGALKVKSADGKTNSIVTGEIIEMIYNT